MSSWQLASLAMLPFASYARELVSPPPTPNPTSTPSLGAGSAFSCWCPWPLVSRSSILFLLGPNHKCFVLSGPPTTLVPTSPHCILGGFRNSCPPSYLGGTAELSETNQSFHKNSGNTIKHGYLKRESLTPRFSKSRLPLRTVCLLPLSEEK